MSFGQKLKKLRLEANLTQKELGDKLNVSFQTVSKWENDTNEPDIKTLKDLSRIFEISYEYLLDDNEVKPIEPSTPYNRDIQKPIYFCNQCGAQIDDSTKIHQIQKTTVTGTTELVTICDDCFRKNEKEIVDKKIKEKQAIERGKKLLKAHKRKVVLTWSIIAAVVSFAIALLVCILNFKTCGIWITIFIPILIGYTVLAEIFCLFTENWIFDVFTAFAGWSIRFPGIIFTFDLDGFVFLFAMKILFAMISIGITVASLAISLGLSSLCSIFTFPFVVFLGGDQA